MCIYIRMYVIVCICESFVGFRGERFNDCMYSESIFRK